MNIDKLESRLRRSASSFGAFQELVDMRPVRLGHRSLVLSINGSDAGPAMSDLFVGPCDRNVGPNSEDYVEVVAHHTKCTNLYCKKTCERFEPALKPDFAVAEVSPGNSIPAAKEGTPYAPANALVNADLRFVDDLLSGVRRHGWSLHEAEM